MFHAGQDEPDGPDAHPAAASAARWARFTFVVLFAMNLLDYLDRWVLSAVMGDLQHEFGFDNARGGLLPVQNNLTRHVWRAASVTSPFDCSDLDGRSLQRTTISSVAWHQHLHNAPGVKPLSPSPRLLSVVKNRLVHGRKIRRN